MSSRRVTGTPLRLQPDRFFDPEPSVRRQARAIYDEIRDFPIVCPHGHVDPAIFATNAPFPEPTALILTPDHYIYRMLYSQGIPLESLGIPTRDGTKIETNPRKIWRLFAAHYHLFRGTPTGVWLDHEFHDIFGLRVQLTAESADVVYDAITERLQSPEFRPRALYERFGIEVLATTDTATDPLAHHQAIRASGWKGRIVPTFRPDALFQIAVPGWEKHLMDFEAVCDRALHTYDAFLEALAARRAHFKQLGATATDHGVTEPYTTRLAPNEVNALFQKALRGKPTAEEQRTFEGHMLVEMARMSTEDGLVMQLHAGSFRDHNQWLRGRFGPNTGADIPVVAEWTRNLHPLLNAHGNDPRFTLILFTLDESTYARELAPLAGHYPAVRLGPPWWFHDSIAGMRRYRDQVSETAGFYNTVGFNDDTRAFCSIPARHDVARRMDANYLAGLVVRGMITRDDASVLARELTVGLVRRAYKFGEPIAPKAKPGGKAPAKKK